MGLFSKKKPKQDIHGNWDMKAWEKHVRDTGIRMDKGESWFEQQVERIRKQDMEKMKLYEESLNRTLAGLHRTLTVTDRLIDIINSHPEGYGQVVLQFSIPNLNIQGSFMSQTINKSTYDAAGGKLPYHLVAHKSTNPNLPIDSVKSVSTSDSSIAPIEQDPSDPTKLHLGWGGEGTATITAVANVGGVEKTATFTVINVEDAVLDIVEG